MKRNCYRIFGMAVAASMLFVGCGDGRGSTEMEQGTVAEATEMGIEEFFLPADEDETVPIITEEYAEEIPYPKLAEFLAAYYQIPEEYQSETRYYYNYVDLDEDGTDEIFAVVIGEYTEVPFGDPAVILTMEEGEFLVLESFEGIHTPVTISEEMTNGWHDIIYQEYGRGTKTGFCICRYQKEGGYQTELSEVVDELEAVGGTQILSNNLIDDMDQGRYMTLAPKEDE